MSTSFDIKALNVVDTWLSTLLYGMNIVVYSACVYILVHRRGGWRSHSVLLAATTFTFATTTCHVGFSLRELIKGFILEPKSHPGDPDFATLAYFSNLADPLDVAKIALYGVNTWVADLLLIWRLYAVWDRNKWLCCIPLLVEATYAGLYLIVVVKLARLPLGESAFGPGFGVLLSAWILHLFVNVAVTSLIAYRLYSLKRLFRKAGLEGQSQSTSIMMTIVESGAVYSATTVLLLALGAAKSIACYAIIGAATQLAVLSPTLIVARIGLGLSHTPSAEELTTLKTVAASRGIPQHLTLDLASTSDTSHIGEYPLNSLERQGPVINIAKNGQR